MSLPASPPVYLVITLDDAEGLGSDIAVADLLLPHGGRLLLDLTAPLRVYEYVVRVPARTLISEWPSVEALKAFLDGGDYRTVRATNPAPWTVTIHPAASDWDPARPGQWMRNGEQVQVPTPPTDGSPGGALYDASPIYHVTLFKALAPEGLPAASKAMAILDLYPNWGGYPVINRAPLEVVEGEWAADRGLLMTQWPCLAAFEDWYLGEPYQKTVKPLRLICGRFTLMAARAFDGCSAQFRRVEA